MNTKELDSEYIAHTYGRFDIALSEGKGSTLYDESGKKYIDFGSGIGVTAFGIGDAEWKKAVTAQLDKLQHVSNLYYTEPGARLAELLCKRTGMKKVFFSNSGAESNECAIKYARKYSFDKYSKDRTTIITLEGSFHGRTITTLSATGQDEFHNYFFPFTPGFKYCPANDIDALYDLADDSVCAVMFECIQGEGGVNNLEPDFVRAVVKLAREKDILMICDEVQTGNGRTGRYFAYENFGITPDIVTTAKGIGGGLPIGAVLFGDKLEGTVTPGSHGSTYGANPVCAAGACSIVSRIDDAFLAEVREKSRYITDCLSSSDGVKSISGMGLMLGIETCRDAKQCAQECLEKGLLVLTAKNKIRLLPALNISYEELDEGLKILKEVTEK